MQHHWGEIDTEVAGERCKINFAVNTLGYSRRPHVFAAPSQYAEHTNESLVRAFCYFGGSVKTVLVDNQKAAVLKCGVQRRLPYDFQPRAVAASAREPRARLNAWSNT